MNKKFKIIIISSLLLMFISAFFYTLFTSSYLNISEIVVNINEGEIPPSIEEYINSYNNKNMFKIDCKEIDKYIERNALIESSKTKITISKKIIINLKKREVNAIIETIDKKNYAILSDKKLYLIDKRDISILNNNILLIEMNNTVLNSLINNSEIIKFQQFINIIKLLDQYCYLISSVKYDNNVKNSFGFFNLKLNNNYTLIRIREEVDSCLVEKAIELSQEINLNLHDNMILDVYHEAIIERNMPLGG